MFGSLLILLILPLVDLSRIRGSQFRPFMKFINWLFFVNFIILMWIGSQHPDEPFVTIGQISTAIYFLYFILFVPLIGIIENTLMDIALALNKNPLPHTFIDTNNRNKKYKFK
jgi:ubiquinol-cytochrome c reductase cytochrome b subunit